MSSKLYRSHINCELTTTVSGSRFETRVFDGYYIDGSHAHTYGAILNDKNDKFRIYHSFDGVGIDIISQNINVVLTTTNNGTPFHEWVWLFIAQQVVDHIFSGKMIDKDKRVMISYKQLIQNQKAIDTLLRHIEKIIGDEMW